MGVKKERETAQKCLEMAQNLANFCGGALKLNLA